MISIQHVNLNHEFFLKKKIRQNQSLHILYILIYFFIKENKLPNALNVEIYNQVQTNF